MRHFEWTLRWIHTFPYLFHDECSTNPTFPLKKNLLRVSSCGVCFIRHISSSAEKLKNKNGNWISRSIKVTFEKVSCLPCLLVTIDNSARSIFIHFCPGMMLLQHWRWHLSNLEICILLAQQISSLKCPSADSKFPFKHTQKSSKYLLKKTKWKWVMSFTCWAFKLIHK